MINPVKDQEARSPGQPVLHNVNDGTFRVEERCLLCAAPKP